LKIFGVQFHPESIASEHGHQIIRNFLEMIWIATRRVNRRIRNKIFGFLKIRITKIS
jgi:GMP synthase-like glutamine amidotransferase